MRIKTHDSEIRELLVEWPEEAERPVIPEPQPFAADTMFVAWARRIIARHTPEAMVVTDDDIRKLLS